MKKVAQRDIFSFLIDAARIASVSAAALFLVKQTDDVALSECRFFSFRRLSASIVFRFGVGIRFGKNNIKADGLCACRLQLIHQSGDELSAARASVPVRKDFFHR